MNSTFTVLVCPPLAFLYRISQYLNSHTGLGRHETLSQAYRHMYIIFDVLRRPYYFSVCRLNWMVAEGFNYVTLKCLRQRKTAVILNWYTEFVTKTSELNKKKIFSCNFKPAGVSVIQGESFSTWQSFRPLDHFDKLSLSQLVEAGEQRGSRIRLPMIVSCIYHLRLNGLQDVEKDQLGVKGQARCR